jgi:uncharacterized protein YdhG (YjbR/CyaY superfamily)
VGRAEMTMEIPVEVENYLIALPEVRKARLLELRETLMATVKGLKESLKHKMPYYEKDGKFVALASQKNYVSVYFCSNELIANIIAKYPDIDTGVGCVRIKDKQVLPLAELKKSFVKAFK